MSSFVCLISYLFYIYISVVSLVLLKMYVGTYETSSLSFFSYQKCVYISLCLSPQFAFCFDDFKTWVDARQNLKKQKQKNKENKN